MSKRKAPPQEERAIGRPSVMTEDVLRKLELAFSIGASDEEACAFAEIGTTALYDYQKANPDFAERKQWLKQKPILKARATVDAAIGIDAELAFKFLERKRRKEFGQQVQHTGEDGGPIQVQTLIGIIKEAALPPVQEEPSHD